MLKVLFVDDDQSSVASVIEALKDDVGEENCRTETTDFGGADAALREFVPDIVVLDVFRGGATPDGDAAGIEVQNIIWERCFCPIVVYSALPGAVADDIKEHPFIKSVQKGSNSEAQVILHIKAFRPHVEALGGIQTSMREHMNREIRNTAPRVFETIDGADRRRDVLVRMARRRIAAMIDEPPDGTMAPWEQYLYPPVGSHLLTGDVIKRKDGDGSNPEDYFVILTPSCDLARDETRGPKVDKVLAARCSNIERSLPEVRIKGSTAESKFKDRILPLLRRGHGTFCLPFPALPGVLPGMTVELKKLEVIELNRIGDEDTCEYRRVVSVDSPFRELITWAYIQVIGRPGLPERDFDGWADQIYSDTSHANEGGTE